MVEVRALEIDGLFEIVPKKHGDDRGFFSESWNKAALAKAGIECDFVQDNHSLSAARGVLRGLHFQLGEAAQAKLVRVIRGAVYDVAVDLRPGSPTRGQWAAISLSAERWNQIFVPAGFAHGFVTTEPNTEVIYKVSTPYVPERERTLSFDDPALAIPWPVPAPELTLSAKDRSGLTLDEALAEVERSG